MPALEVVEEFQRVALGTFRSAARDLRLGLRLLALHVEAGVGVPDGIDAGARLGPLAELAPMYEAVYRSLLPAALALDLTTQAQSDRWFKAFADDSAGAEAHAALWPLLIGTWKRKTPERHMPAPASAEHVAHLVDPRKAETLDVLDRPSSI